MALRRALRSRHLATAPSGTFVFDRALKVKQRDRAAAAPDSAKFDYLRAEVADRLVDRLADIKGRRFERILDVGAHHGPLLPLLRDGGFGLEELVLLDSSATMLHRDAADADESGLAVTRVVADEEQLLNEEALQEKSFDAVLSSMALHWINDLPGALIQSRMLLKPDGVFLGAMLGGDTLQELRAVLQIAEQQLDGGVSQWVSPMVGVDDAGSLLSRAGFTLLTVDSDTLTVPYPDMQTLCADLRRMGDGNACTHRRGGLPPELLKAAAKLYDEKYGEFVPGPDGEPARVVPATFQIIYLIGWAPAETQPKPMGRGTASASLSDGLSASASAPEAFSLKDIARETGGTVGRVTVSGADRDV